MYIYIYIYIHIYNDAPASSQGRRPAPTGASRDNLSVKPAGTPLYNNARPSIVKQLTTKTEWLERERGERERREREIDNRLRALHPTHTHTVDVSKQ